MNNVKYITGLLIIIWFFSFIASQYRKAKKEEISYRKNRKDESERK